MQKETREFFSCTKMSKVLRSHFKCGLYFRGAWFLWTSFCEQELPAFFCAYIMNKNIFIGPIIKQKLDESSYSVEQFRQELNCCRKSVYNLFNKKSIDIDLLIEISELLNFDFLSLYINDSETSSTKSP